MIRMPKYTAFLAGAFSMIACCVWASDAGTNPWRLIWRDEFDQAGQPDPDKWGYEEGYVRNDEVQYYMRRRLKNARVEGGRLVIEAHRESLPNPNHDRDSTHWQKRQRNIEYTAASLTTKGRASWVYGRVEVRARVPKGQGVWPAIWMLGVNHDTAGYPKCGEIDIMEFVGHTPGTIYGTVHYPLSKPSPDKFKESRGGTADAQAPWNDFHIYAIEWTPDRIDFFYDQMKYFTFRTDEAGRGADNPFRKPHYLLINFALGGSWGGRVDDSILPQRYEIDYVRVYQRERPPAPRAPASGSRSPAAVGHP